MPCPECPHCTNPDRKGNRNGLTIDMKILEKLQASPFRHSLRQVHELFPNYALKSIKDALSRLKKQELAKNEPYGNWSA